MLPGEQIGRYQIVSKIGQGGMGEVYLAEDIKLCRRVALKVLPAKIAGDVDCMLRFEHEARTTSALNHPNIVTIYEIDDEGGSLYIAMELVEGRTLGSYIKNGDLDLAKTLDVAIQVASALAAAHQASVVHRDIKPDNVIVRPDGLVKVLDFGLAKLTEKPDAQNLEALSTIFKTSPGLVMGTIGYMSPEQTRGKQVDARSDIFSFGTLLYQMLTGKRPFIGDNNADIVVAILNQDPVALADAAPGTPSEFEAVVRKALRKDRDERYQSAREMLADLRNVREALSLGNGSGRAYGHFSDPAYAASTHDTFERAPSTAELPHETRSSISAVLFDEIKLHPLISVAATFGLAVVLGIVGYAAVQYYNRSVANDAFQSMRPSKLTSSGNVSTSVGNTAVSPDGKLIAYVTSEAGEMGLWTKQTATGGNVPLVPAANIRYDGVVFSADSANVYYIASEPHGISALYQVPALGGTPRKLVVGASGPISFSPDGGRISFVRSQTELLTADRNGGDIRSVMRLSEGKIFLVTSWAPDTTKIAAAVYYPSDSREHLIEIGMNDGSEKPFPSPEWKRVRGLAWLPEGDGVVVGGRDPETDLAQLWTVSYPGGEARRITNDLNSYQALSLTGDGRTVVTTQQIIFSNIWASSLGDAGNITKVTTEVGKDEGMSGVSWTPDGRIVYTTRIKSDQNIWIINRDGSDNRQLTFDSKANFSPAVTSDGRYIIFVSTRGGGPSVWRMDIDGSNPVLLTDGPGAEINPSVSPDGKWVFYQWDSPEKKNSIWKVNIDGGTPVRLTKMESSRPVVSPDGRFFACEYGERLSSPSSRLAVIPIDGGEPFKLHDLPRVLRSRVFYWSSDGRSMLYSDSRERVDNIWSQPLEGGEPRQLTRFKEDRIFRFGISADGHFTLGRGTDTSDAVMLTNFR